MGILGNEAADVLAKNAAEGVPPDDHEKWMSGGSIRQWAKERNLEEEASGGRWKRGCSYWSCNEMAAESSNQLLPTSGRKWHREVVE